MIPFLVINATYTEPTIPLIDVAPFIAGTVIGVTLSIAFLAYILRKDPTIRWRAQRKSWSWSFFKSASGDIKILPVMEENLDEDNTFDYGTKDKENKGSYLIQTSDDKGRPTQYSHNGHPAYFHSHNQTAPHTWLPGNSLDSSVSPQAIYKVKDGQIRKQIDTIQVKDPTPKSNFGIIAMVVVVIILIIALYEQIGGVMNFLQSHFASNPTTNSTVTCPTGYTANTRGQCIPNGMPFTDLIGILGVNVLNMPFLQPKNYRNNLRKYLRFDKTRAFVANWLYLLSVPAILFAFILPRLSAAQTAFGVYDYDITLPTTVLYILCLIPAIIYSGKIGDRLFVRSNPWAKGMKIDQARKLIRITRRQRRLRFFWELVEK